ncbi:hypothetical protein [Leucothrix mucor]|uniref:hypothetical protein n=1 Tax=Leucothrix mucor TaxID=45248 RepID=UPI0003B55628|nr:hypothetical protein [Leucothrix mucor]
MRKYFISILRVMILVFCSVSAHADIQKIYVDKEIDDDHIVVVTEKGDQLLLEKWNLSFSPLLFEGRTFLAEVSPMWVTIHFDDRDSIKWSIEKILSNASAVLKAPTTVPQAKTHKQVSACYKSYIQEPSPFNGNGGELILLGDGTIWKESSYQYLYLYEYSPSVIICPSEGKMTLGSHVFTVVKMK